MKERRRFSVELKRGVVEELLSWVSTPAQLMRRHEISSGFLYHWKEQYARGRFNNEPTEEAALEDRVRQLLGHEDLHVDDASMIIVKTLWEKVKKKNILQG